ncbi:MAG: aminotransferase class III-fold pyridoxal phosphate-dependent enzyme [Deltaproteobacteria bacterium]
MSAVDAPGPSRFPRSEALLARARERIPGLTFSMMKRPEVFAPGRFPAYLASGRGAEVEDVDGHRYVDFVCGLGATSLGHGHPQVLAAVQEVMDRGFLHSLPVELELQAADALVELIPGAEMARFFKTGADATSAAVRLARATTKKDRIITVGYNGWHDHFMFDTPGVPAALTPLTRRMPLFTPADEAPILEAVAAGADDTAVVLLSLPYNRRVERPFLVALREACTRAGVLLVFDEIVTGFRLAVGGAQQHFDVAPDFACFSKALAAGLPLSAVAGPRSALEPMEQLQVSTTFGGETLSLAACVAALRVYRDTAYVDDIARLGRRLAQGVDEASRRLGTPLVVVGYDCLPFFLFDRAPDRHAPLAREFVALMAERGFLLRRDLNFICAAHTEAQIDAAIEAAERSLETMVEAGCFAGAEPR